MPDAHRETGRRQDVAGGFDYVIVGAGSAGCVVARRLVEGTEATVLVLEAGGTDEGAASIANPSRWMENIGSPYDWAYTYAAEPAPRQSLAPLARGKVLGGCGSINAMLWGAATGPTTTAGRRPAMPAGISNRSSLVQEIGGLGGRRERVPRGGRADARRASPGSRPGVHRPHRRRPILRDAVSGRHEYPPSRGRRPPESQRPGRPALQPVERPSCARRCRREAHGLDRAQAVRLRLSGTRCVGLDVLVEGKRHAIDASREVILSAGAIDTPRSSCSPASAPMPSSSGSASRRSSISPAWVAISRTISSWPGSASRRSDRSRRPTTTSRAASPSGRAARTRRAGPDAPVRPGPHPLG